MKPRIIIAVSLLVFSIGFNCISYKENDTAKYFGISDIEALARGESEEYLKCYCALLTDSNCAVNNNGSSVCAGGNNVKCWEYNRNCN